MKCADIVMAPPVFTDVNSFKLQTSRVDNWMAPYRHTDTPGEMTDARDIVTDIVTDIDLHKLLANQILNPPPSPSPPPPPRLKDKIKLCS